nr:MAG TPA: Thioredoxin [Caudoviricetes sp.]
MTFYVPCAILTLRGENMARTKQLNLVVRFNGNLLDILCPLCYTYLER